MSCLPGLLCAVCSSSAACVLLWLLSFSGVWSCIASCCFCLVCVSARVLALLCRLPFVCWVRARPLLLCLCVLSVVAGPFFFASWLWQLLAACRLLWHVMVALRSAVFLCVAPSIVSASVLSARRNNGLSALLYLCLTVVQNCFCVAGTCEDCATAGSGLEVYGRFARDFDFDLFRAAAGKVSAAPAVTHASLPTRPHCDPASSAPVVIDASTGERTALFPGGITQRAAPDFSSVISRLAASATSPGEVASSALRAQALQTGMVCCCRCRVLVVRLVALVTMLSGRGSFRLWRLLLRMWCLLVSLALALAAAFSLVKCCVSCLAACVS